MSMYRPTMLAAALVAGLGLAAPAHVSQALAQQAPQPLSEAAFAAQTCNLCHGSPTYVSPTMPPIHGVDAKTLYEALIEVKTNKKPSTIMGRIARGYSEDQLKAIAEHLARN